MTYVTNEVLFRRHEWLESRFVSATAEIRSRLEMILIHAMPWGRWFTVGNFSVLDDEITIHFESAIPLGQVTLKLQDVVNNDIEAIRQTLLAEDVQRRGRKIRDLEQRLHEARNSLNDLLFNGR